MATLRRSVGVCVQIRVLRYPTCTWHVGGGGNRRGHSRCRVTRLLLLSPGITMASVGALSARPVLSGARLNARPRATTARPTAVVVRAANSQPGMGLHSSTFQLNLSALYGIGGVRKGLCSPS